MFGIGMGELIIILIIALIIFGPNRLPEVGRTIGRAMAEMNKATQDIKSTLNTAVEEELAQDKNQRLKAVETETKDTPVEEPRGGSKVCSDDSDG